MVTAFVLINAQRGMVPTIAEALNRLEGVAEVHSVAGAYDVVAVIRVKDNEALAKLVTEHLQRTEGVERTQTLISFRAFSRFDLERLFSIGME